MAESLLSHLEEDLSCPVCCDVFRDPVVLRCSHSFCRACLDQHWVTSGSRDCPICRSVSQDGPVANLTLRGACESIKKERWLEKEGLCPEHGEVAAFFCLDDDQPICSVCKSWVHLGHHVRPIQEEVQNCQTHLGSQKKKRKNGKKVTWQDHKTAQHIKNQAQLTERQIKEEFEKLHRFLRDEEAVRIALLREEEEQKSQAVKEKILSLSNRADAVDEDDFLFLQDNRTTRKRDRCPTQDLEMDPGALINVAQHLGNLKCRVWEKMLEIIQYAPVTLDPNTAHPSLVLSDELTSVRLGKREPLPSNPERFDKCVAVLGSEGFLPGTHFWDVEVGDTEEWTLGVVRESVQKKGFLSLSQRYGVWAIRRKDGVYSIPTNSQSGIRLQFCGTPRKIHVRLDWPFISNEGRVSFSDAVRGETICTFNHTCRERLYPFLSPGLHQGRMQIIPDKVHVQVGTQESFIEKYWPGLVLTAFLFLICILLPNKDRTPR